MSFRSIFRAKVFSLILCIGIIAQAQRTSQVIAEDSPPNRIDPKVIEALKERGSAQVFIVLRHQPQREAVRRATEIYGPTIAAEGEKLRSAQDFKQAEGNATRQLQDDIDGYTVELRRQAAREMYSLIRGEQEVLSRKLEASGSTSIHRYLMVNAISATVSAETLEWLESESDVAEVFLARTDKAQLNISTYALGANTFWSNGYSGSGQSVAVLDTGVISHPAFSGLSIYYNVFLDNAKTTPCFFDDLTINDYIGHGTHVTGIIASRGSLGWEAYQGVARGLSTLYAYKVAYYDGCTLTGEANIADVISAVDWSLQNTSTSIFNYSFASVADSDDDGPAKLLDLVVDSYGVTFVVAAGNDGPAVSTLGSPGIAYNGITIANMDDRNTYTRGDDAIYSSSSRGPTKGGRFKPDIAAPGTNIYSTAFNWNGGPSGSNLDFISMSGTSMAAPHITGAVALLRQTGVTSPLAQKAILINTTDTSGWKSDIGWGYANLQRAFEQRSTYFLSSVSANGHAGAFKFFSSGSTLQELYATLVWNRHVESSSLQGYLDDLDLYLYDLSTGNEVQRSDSAIQNVEQIAAVISGNYALKVRSWTSAYPNGISTEAFALAVSETGITARIGPILITSCTGPQNATIQTNFQVICTVSNSGDLPAYSVNCSLTIVGGGTGTQNCGNLSPNSSSNVYWTVSAGSQLSTMGLQASAASTSFGEVFAGNSSFSVNIIGSAPSINISVSSLDFGSDLVKSQSIGKNVRIDNVGTATLNIISQTVSGDFRLVAPCPSQIPAGGGCSPVLTFLPSQYGTRTGALTIVSNAPGSPHTISLTGNGIDIVILLSRPSRPKRSGTETVVSRQAFTALIQTSGLASGAITLGCSVVPAEADCSITPAVVPALGSSTTPATVVVDLKASKREIAKRLRERHVHNLVVTVSAAVGGVSKSMEFPISLE